MTYGKLHLYPYSVSQRTRNPMLSFSPCLHRIITSVILLLSTSSTVEAEAQRRPPPPRCRDCQSGRGAWVADVGELAKKLDDAGRGSEQRWRGGNPLGRPMPSVTTTYKCTTAREPPQPRWPTSSATTTRPHRPLQPRPRASRRDLIRLKPP